MVFIRRGFNARRQVRYETSEQKGKERKGKENLLSPATDLRGNE